MGPAWNKFVKYVATVFSVTYLSVSPVCLDPPSLPWQPDVISWLTTRVEILKPQSALESHAEFI